MMRIGIASDHGGFELKGRLVDALKEMGHEVTDFGALSFDNGDDYPDYIIPMAKAQAEGLLDRSIAVCGSGVGASVAANKVAGVRAALVSDVFSAHQGVEDDDMNMLCLGGRVVGPSLALDLVKAFLNARFSGAERHMRRLIKVRELEGANG